MEKQDDFGIARFNLQNITNGLQIHLPPGTVFAIPKFSKLEPTGEVIGQVQVVPIFWGRAWNSAKHPSPDAVVKAITHIVRSPYLSALSQYVDGRFYTSEDTLGYVLHELVVTSEVTWDKRTSPADPPNPFSNKDVTDLITNLIGSGQLGQPGMPGGFHNHSLLYVVFMPTGVSSNRGDIDGNHYGTTIASEHGQPTDNGKIVRTPYPIAWVMSGSRDAQIGDSLDTITAMFSHELAEAVSDPFGEGVRGRAGVCGDKSSWCEVGDICESSTARLPTGELVQGYWSDQAATCVAPTSFPPRENNRPADPPIVHLPRFDHLAEVFKLVHGGDPAPDHSRQLKDAITLYVMEEFAATLSQRVEREELQNSMQQVLRHSVNR